MLVFSFLWYIVMPSCWLMPFVKLLQMSNLTQTGGVIRVLHLAPPTPLTQCVTNVVLKTAVLRKMMQFCNISSHVLTRPWYSFVKFKSLWNNWWCWWEMGLPESWKFIRWLIPAGIRWVISLQQTSRPWRWVRTTACFCSEPSIFSKMNESLTPYKPQKTGCTICPRAAILSSKYVQVPKSASLKCSRMDSHSSHQISSSCLCLVAGKQTLNTAVHYCPKQLHLSVTIVR